MGNLNDSYCNKQYIDIEIGGQFKIGFICTHLLAKQLIEPLKSGKNDGSDGLTSNYLLNAWPLLYEYLSFLFICCITVFHLLYFHNDSNPKKF